MYNDVCVWLHYYCVQSSFQKLELENKNKDTKIQQKSTEIQQKDAENQQLHKDVERLGYQVKYLNSKVNAMQDHLRGKKVCIVLLCACMCVSE